MKMLIIIGVVIGILASLWTVTAIKLNLIIFVGFLAWSTFFAAGGKKDGLKTTLITNFSGLVWGAIIMALASLLDPVLGSLVGLALAVFIGAAAMCIQSKFAILSFIPGTFIGCAAYFGANFDFVGTLTALIIGAFLGYSSEAIYEKLGQTEDASDVENIQAGVD